MRQLQEHVADAAELLARLGGVDIAEQLNASETQHVMSLTDKLLRATRDALEKRVDDVRRERLRADADADRLDRLERHYADLEAERSALAARLDRAETSALGPMPKVDLLRRVVRVAVAALVGGVVAGPLAGPVVTFVLHDPILGKAFEGFLGALAGAIVSEANGAWDEAAANDRRTTARLRPDDSP